MSRWHALLKSLQCDCEPVQFVQNVQNTPNHVPFEQNEQFEHGAEKGNCANLRSCPAPVLVDQESYDERAAIIQANGIPKEWAEGFALLCTMERPAAFAPERWRQLVDDGGYFLDAWGRQAAALGWRAVDVFGVNPDAPEWRYDSMGLVSCLHGRHVVAIAENTARIDCEDGASLTFYRHTLSSEAVALWSLGNLK
ncbi:MAG: hypothetical protein AB7S81_05230 [Bdellovibrionales bacterium]